MNTQRFRGHFKGVALGIVFALAVAGFGAARLRSDMQTANQPASVKLADPNEGPKQKQFRTHREEGVAGSGEHRFFQGGSNAGWFERPDAANADGSFSASVLRG